MSLKIIARPENAGQVLPCVPAEAVWQQCAYPTDDLPQLQDWPVGTTLHGETGAEIFRIVDFCWVSTAGHAICCPVLQPAAKLQGELELTPRPNPIALAVVTLSDKGARGQRVDTAGPMALQLASAVLEPGFSRLFLLGDEESQLTALLAHLALNCRYDLILTSGGTGLSPRDITPQATARLLDLQLPGLSQAMMQSSLQKTPHAGLSRGLAGIIGRCLVINLPGSKKAVAENLEAILPALPHGLKKLRGDPSDCGQEV